MMEDPCIYRPSNLLYTQENISRYHPGGYHPVCLGDTFQEGRYSIHHKLGWGGFSTVWLAKDSKRMHWVSIKIMTAESTEHSHELRHLQSLATHSQKSPGSKYIVQLLDDFLHQGPNGTHQCLVFELLGPTVDIVLRDYHEFGDRLEPDTILSMSEQLLQAIVFLHDVGYVHGDISGRNVAFTSHRLSRMTDDCLWETLGTPKSADLVRLDGKPLDKALPHHLVQAAGWDDWIDEDDEELRIIDLGETDHQGAKCNKLAQPSALQAPEMIFTGSFDHRLDLWRAGCVIYSFVFGALPFWYLGDLDVLVAQMNNFVEELPLEWQPKWDRMRLNSNYVEEPLITETSPSKLEQRFNEKVQEETLKPILPVIRGLMRFVPSDRLSAMEALNLLRSTPQQVGH